MVKSEGSDPAKYNLSPCYKKDTFNTGSIPFGVCKPRFDDDLSSLFHRQPGIPPLISIGPGEYFPDSNQANPLNSHKKKEKRPVFISTVPKFQTEKQFHRTNLKPNAKMSGQKTSHAKKQRYKSLVQKPIKPISTPPQDLGPGKYNPSTTLIYKTSPAFSLKNPRTPQIHKQNLLAKPTIQGLHEPQPAQILGVKGQDRQAIKSVADIISIEKSLLKKMAQGANASFVSTTKRMDYRSDVPGPGAYEVISKHKKLKNPTEKNCSYDSFGTNEKRAVEFNRNINFPFTDPTFVENPPVGQYDKHKSVKVKTGFKNKPKVLRKYKRARKKVKGFPGPGSYNVDFLNELQTLDYQLSDRYGKNPFGSNLPRFNQTISKTFDTSIRDQYINNIHSINRQKEKKAEILQKFFKKQQESKQSYFFQSETQRFIPQNAKTPSGKPSNPPKSKKLKILNSLQSAFNPSGVRPVNSPYALTYIVKRPGFNSHSPRFHSPKESPDPGPGHYSPKVNQN
ncbi:unnamed protein product [Moneuplotes crassus]|uniref:Uncharacterized protein n=1 Tax=Euplotes crassus TaxID=5936 RepID=A0AAD1X9C1_EUPCR|nr:unnamed protein product [Moneuplotes crassus]